tara:strand:+ start:125 stop:1606 length:1482 start_codon:yes stop_codon:yes gene_type:complete
MKKLLALLLLTPLVVSEEDKWWEQDLGIYANLYDILLAETFEQREARFYGAAEDLKSLACRSEVAFNNSDRNMNKCRADAEERFVKQYKELLYLEKNQKKSGGLNFLGAELDYLEPSIAASLIVASWGSMHQECIPENQGKQNISGKVYIDGCTDKYPQLILQNLWNANRYTRVKFLERRGLLVANNKDQEFIQTNELLDASDYEVSKLIRYLDKEFKGVYCRSAFGIKVENDDECFKEAEIFFKDIQKGIREDMSTNNIKYVDKSIVDALGTQYITLAIEKCAPFNLFLDKKFDAKTLSREEHEKIANAAVDCTGNVLDGFTPALNEAELILKREAEWKKEVERKRQLRIAEAKSKKEREARKLQVQKEKDAERESIGGFFGRLLVAVIVESADVYVKDKIAKELNIKTGTYHSQDSSYCYYSSPTGMKRLKKKGGKSRTINYGNVGTNKPVFSYKKMPSGWSEKNTIYSFSDSSTMKVQKTAIYGCPQRIE